MTGLNDNGLTIKRLPDIIAELEAALKLQFGNDLDLSENSLFGIINTIYAAANAENWELLQALYNAFIIDVASGKQLDDLAALLNLTRLKPTKSFGDLELFGVASTIVPTGTQFSDTLGNTYISTEEGSLLLGTSRTPVNISGQGGTGTVGDPSTTYQLTINGDLYSYQTLWPENNPDFIASKLAEKVPSGLTYKVETREEGNPAFINEIINFFDPAFGFNRQSFSFINVINLDENNPITVSVNIINSTDPLHESTNTPFLGVGTKVSTFTDTVKIEATTTGTISSNKNTINSIDTPVTGLVSVNNPEDIITGRDLETDEELRLRFKESSSINGNTTVPSITARLQQVEGVSKAFVVENRTLQEDTKGRPAKSYECVVVGGTNEAIGEVIWNSKPAGIETYGTTTVSLQDDQGNSQAVKFSRPDSIYIWVKVYYSKYSEEAFPTGGEDSMKSSTVTYGSSLDLGEDVIPTRFFGSIYSSTTGIGNLRVLIAKSSDPNTEPTLSSFKAETITIESNEISAFTLDRVEIIEE